MRSAWIPKRGVLLAALLFLCARGGYAGKAQENASQQLPESMRGAKVYPIPEEAGAGTSAENPVIYRGMSYQEMNFERLVLNLSLSVKPVDRAATIRKIFFQDIRVNDVPVHVETFEEEFKLSKKEVVDLPAPLKCSIIFSEIESLAPVKEIVTQDKIRITGQSFVEVKLNVLEKVALRAKRLVLPAKVNEEVPLQMFSGNPLLQMAAARILDTLSDPSTGAAMALAKEHLARLTEDRDLASKVRPSLFLLYCEYEIRDLKTGAAEKFSQSGTGFVIGPEGKLVTAKRVLEPWKFDPQVAALIQRDHLEVETKSVRLAAWPAGAAVLGADGQLDFQTALTTDKQTLEVIKTAPDRMEKQDYQDSDSGEKTRISLHAPGEGDVAVLRLVGSNAPPLAWVEPGAAGANAKTALCSFAFGLSQTPADPKPAWIKAATEGPLLALERQLHPGEAGAPLVTSEGKVVALCSGTNECLPVEIIRKQIP